MPDALPITVAQAAAIIGVTRQRVSQLIAAGELLPTMRMLSVILLDVVAVEAYAEARRQRLATIKGNKHERAREARGH